MMCKHGKAYITEKGDDALGNICMTTQLKKNVNSEMDTRTAAACPTRFVCIGHTFISSVIVVQHILIPFHAKYIKANRGSG